MYTNRHYDVLVVGARCAGAATAMLMARQGLRVLAIDRGSYGSDAVSTHALMRGGVLQLWRWGLLPRLVEAGTPAVRSTAFHYGDDVLQIDIQPAHGVDALYAPRRTVLDSMLVDAASEAGATIWHGYALVDLVRRGDGRVCGGVVLDPAGKAIQIEADLVVGADGIGSSVARLAEAQTMRKARHSTAVVFGYFPGIRSSGYHWYFRPRCSAGAIPTNAGEHCVFVSLPPETFQHPSWRRTRMAAFVQTLRQFSPHVADAVDPRTPDVSLRVFGGSKGFLRQAWGPGWALVGDAGYFRDPLTAHGITDALRDAELLANAAACGDASSFAAYAEARDTLSIPLLDVTDAIASFDWDLGTVQSLHQQLNLAMKQELAHILALPTAPVRVAATPELIEETVA